MAAACKYIIEDENKLPYYSLLFGIGMDAIEPIKIAIANGADINKVKVGQHYEKSLHTLLRYAQHQCSSEVYEYLSSLSATDEDAFAVVAKAIAETHPEIDSIIKKHINPENVNTQFGIYEFYNPFTTNYYKSKKVNILHIAAYHQNSAALQTLKKLGGNVNAKTSDDETLGSLISHRKHNAEIVIKLLELGVDLHQQCRSEAEGKLSSSWSRIINHFKVRDIIKICNYSLPEELSLLSLLDRRSIQLSRKFVKHFDFAKYPLLGNIKQYENLGITFKEVVDKSEEGFFRHSSLKNALRERYKLSSASFTVLINNNIFQRNNSYCTVDNNILKICDYFYKLFPNNYCDFLVCVEKYQNIRHNAHPIFDAENKLIPFLKNFTDKQIKTLLLRSNFINQSSGYSPYHDVVDTVEMFNRYETELKLCLNRVPFKKIDTMKKLHDFFTKEVMKLRQQLYNLEQNKHYPALDKVDGVKLLNNYEIIVAKTNHDLVKWGNELGHCIGNGSYAEKAKSGNIILLAIGKNGEAEYAIEIKKGRLIQIQGKSCDYPPEDLVTEFANLMKKHNLLA